MPDTVEVRMAHIEGAFEQIDKRLERVETRIEKLDSKMDSQFLWILGFQVLTWLSVLGTFLAAWVRKP